ncbi:MAG: multicopper oxidase domain-containing protein [bacterium]
MADCCVATGTSFAAAGCRRTVAKHTVNVASGERARIEFSADNPGRWIFHCHNVFHLEAGMARVFEYGV